MKYFVRWYDEQEYTEVSENFMNAYSEYNESFKGLNKRYYTELPAMILLFDGKAGADDEHSEMYFTRTYIDEQGKVVKE